MSTSGDPLLVCFDGSDGARRAIEGAGDLFNGRRAIVLTVWQPSMATLASFNRLGEMVGQAGGLFRDIDEIAARQAAEQAEEGAQLAIAAGLDAEPRAARGLLWQKIVAVAEEEGACAVVLGARGLGGIQSALMGSVSTAVVHHCRQPVLVVPPPSERPLVDAG